MSEYNLLISFSFQSFTFIWGHNISWGSCANQLQPADSISDYIYLLLNINNKAVFATINTDDGSWLTNVYVSTESWTWVSFIKFSYPYKVIGFQDSTNSYVKVYNGNTFSTYILSPTIKLYGFTNTIIYSL